MGMAFLCPKCDQPRLEIELSIELPADDSWDENSVQLAACQACGLRAITLYQESRRGSLQDEAWQHFGAVISAEAYQLLAEMFSGCPAPMDRSCRCTAHRCVDVESFFQPGSVSFPLIRPSTI
jgi:Zn ribbon nucleic-acid-binding protein